MKNLRSALFKSVISLILCFSMLLGTTYAWFTDTVTSGNNIIKAGNLDLQIFWTDDITDSDSWRDAEDASAGAIFDYDRWEPGYTCVRYIKIVNNGTLAFKYIMNILPDGEMGILADVIDVYYMDNYNVDASGKISSIGGMTKAGTLADVVTKKVSSEGKLLPKDATNSGETIVAIAMNMQESADNRYQGKSIGTTFSIEFLATQLAYEEDAFGPEYDKDSDYTVFEGDFVYSHDVRTTDNVVQEETSATSENGEVTSKVNPGTKVKDGVTKLTVAVSTLEETSSNMEARENEVLIPVDVHVEGIAEDNTVPVIVALDKFFDPGLNLGNYELAHVEDGVTNIMTSVSSPAELDAHNEYYYDPATGTVSVALCSFSEVVAVYSNESAWEGNFDYNWYDASKTELTIANADQLAAFGAIVGGMKKVTGRVDGKYTYSDEVIQDSFAGKTVKLLADINLGDKESENNPDIIFHPIGYWNNEGTYERKPAEERTEAVSSGFYAFEGTFDGNGNTISNFYQNTWEIKGDHDWYSAVTEQYFRDGMGLFGKVYGGTVKNLTIDNFSSDGEITTTGVIAAYADSKEGKPAIFENIAITNCNPRVYNIGNGGIVGCAGWYSKDNKLGNDDYTNAVVFRNITVDQTNKISALWGTYDVSCGGILGQYYPNSGCGIKLENCHVSAIIDVNNDVCANYQYYWYRYSGMFIGTIRANKTEGGYTVADPTGIMATNCTYSYGSWNEYWYCELVKNSGASYTHDYQFGRLDNINDLSEIKSGETWIKEGNFALVSDDRKSVECYHIFKDSNGNLYRHFHDVEDESNPNIYEDFDLNGDGELNDLKEDRQRYYLPFGQVFNGLGYGVKPTYTYDGFTLVEDGTVISGEKFKVKNGADLTYRPGETVYLKDLVNLVVDASKLSQSSLYVSASPVDKDGTVSIKYNRDVENWMNNNFVISNDTQGAIKIVITDYFYCTPTVIYLNPEQAAEKFTANTVGAQNAYTQITLGTLFGVEDGATIGNVTATVTDPNGNETTVTGTSSDWATKTINLTKDGEWKVAIKDNDEYCSVTEVTFTVNKVDKFESKFTGDFLYRVGNANTVAWTSLFADLSSAIAPQKLNVTVVNVKGDAAGTFTNGEIKFTGTGVVKVTISADGANPLTINLEVVNATNITNATDGTGKDFVLLKDVTYTGTYLYYKKSTLYGNGFTLDITDADHSDMKLDGSGKKSAYCNIWMVDSRFDNIRIVGSVYPSVGMTAESDYGNAAIRTEGDCYITNSYISNCRVPLRVQGDTTLINTVVDGGRYANIELRSGKLTLDGVTTINTVRKGSNGTTDVIGFGIVIHSEAANASIAVTGDGLKQYNWVGENEHKTILSGDTYLSSAYKLIFNANNSNSIYFAYNNDRYVNTGILCLCADMTKDVVTGLDDRYCQTVSGYNAWVLTYDNSKHTAWFNESIDTKTVTCDHKQQPVLPTYTGNEAQTVEFIKGETYYFDTSVLTAEKFGQQLTISSVKMNGTTYNYGDKISVTEGGIFEIVYTVVDPYNYNADGTVADSVKHTVSITLTAVAKDAEILAPKFTFIDQNGNKYESTTVKVGDKTYVMPNVTAADPTTNSMSSINIGSASISGTTVYFPIAKGHTVRSGSNFNRYYPLFNGINITDYTIAGDTTGTTYTTSGNYTSLVGSSGTKFIIPANGSQANCGDYVKTDGQAGNAAGNSDSGWQGAGYSTSYGGTYLKSGNTNASSGADKNGYERIVWVEYCFNAGNGDVFYYRIGYHCNKESAQTCVTGDTLISLADGSQKRIDAVTNDDLLLVWDFYSGEYAVVPSALVQNHGYGWNTVIKMTYSDGTVTKAVNEHGYFDATLNEFVMITADNVEEYIGHEFVKADGDSYTTVTLMSAEVTNEYTEAYSILTVYHFNFIADDMFSLTSPTIETNVFMPFEVGENMTFDAEKMEAAIAEFGLYEYEDFEGQIPYEVFDALNFKYLKVTLGKNLVADDQVLELLKSAGVIG